MRKALILMAMLTVLIGCATGPKFNTVESGLSSVPPGKARIYFYRSTSFGGAIQPDIRLNSVLVGRSEPNGIFFVDEDPGNIEVVTGSEVEKKLTFTVNPGETRYVKCSVTFGVLIARIIPELVSEEEAKKEIMDLAYTGKAQK